MEQRDGSDASFWGFLKQWDGSDASFWFLKQWDGSGASFWGKMEQRDGSKPLKKSGKMTVLAQIREMFAGWYYDLI